MCIHECIYPCKTHRAIVLSFPVSIHLNIAKRLLVTGEGELAPTAALFSTQVCKPFMPWSLKNGRGQGPKTGHKSYSHMLVFEIPLPLCRESAPSHRRSHSGQRPPLPKCIGKANAVSLLLRRSVLLLQNLVVQGWVPRSSSKGVNNAQILLVPLNCAVHNS